MNENAQIKIHAMADLSSVNNVILILILSCADRPPIVYLCSLIMFWFARGSFMWGFRFRFNPDEKVQKLF